MSIIDKIQTRGQSTGDETRMAGSIIEKPKTSHGATTSNANRMTERERL